MAEGDITTVAITPGNNRYRPAASDPPQLMLQMYGYDTTDTGSSDGLFTEGIRFGYEIIGQNVLSSIFYFQGTSSAELLFILRELPHNATGRGRFRQYKLIGDVPTVQIRPPTGRQELIIGVCMAGAGTFAALYLTDGTFAFAPIASDFAIGEDVPDGLVIDNDFYLEWRPNVVLATNAAWITTIEL